MQHRRARNVRARTHKNMKRNHTIGFDAESAARSKTGIGNYGRFIINALASACVSNTYLRLYITKQHNNAYFDRVAALRNVEAMEPDGRLWRRLSWLWRAIGVSRDAKNGSVELYHGLDNRLPYGLAHYNIRSIITIHDLRFLRFGSKNPISAYLDKHRLHSSCRRADRIIAVSEGTKHDLVELMNIDPEKIDVIYTGCDPCYTAPIDAEYVAAVKEQYKLPERYILNVGTQSKRRNIELILDAMTKLPEPIDLVAVGAPTSHTRRLAALARKLGIDSRVHFIVCDSNEELAAIYRGAELLVNPTHYSTFGMPLVEALNVGIPVIGATGSSHEEAAGPNGIYVSTDNSAELADKIDALLNNEELRRQVVEHGKSHVSRFRPEVTAYNILNCYKRIGIDLNEYL